MRSGRVSSGAVALVFATLLVCGLTASVQPGARRQAIYVVAVRDSGALTMCPALREATMTDDRTWTSDGRAMVRRLTDDLQLLRFPPRESPVDSRVDPLVRTELSPTQAILPVPWTATEDARLPPTSAGTELGRDVMAIDPALRQAVEQELARLGTYEVADSVESAEVVLLIEGSYIALVASSTTDTGRPDQAQSPLGRSAQPGDWQRNLLQAVLAIAAPAEVYRANPGGIPTLLSARIWEGSEVYQPPYRVSETSRATGVTRIETRWTWEPASPEALVWQFAGRKPRPASHPPLCAASNQTFRAPAVASSVAVVPAVSYVTVPVSVTDGEGRAVVDLDPSLFRVYEDETLQAIDRVDRPGGSVNVTLLVDTSSSMRRKADETDAAIAAAVSAFSRIGTLVMASFDRRVVLHSALPDTRDRRPPAVNQPSPTVGRTATRLYDALDLLLAGPLKTPPARTALVIMTDGVDTASRLADAETARRRMGESQIPAYVIHYDTSQDNAPVPPSGGISLFINGERPDLTRRLLPEDAGDPGPAYARAADFLRQIAHVSGGRLIAAPAARDLEKTFADMATELSQQHTVAYYPANQARDGTYRRIRVEVDRPGVRVRTRPGYYQTPIGDVPRRH